MRRMYSISFYWSMIQCRRSSCSSYGRGGRRDGEWIANARTLLLLAGCCYVALLPSFFLHERPNDVVQRMFQNIIPTRAITSCSYIWKEQRSLHHSREGKVVFFKCLCKNCVSLDLSGSCREIITKYSVRENRK